MSLPASNSTLMELWPKALVESMLRIPSMPLSTCSRGSVMVASTVSGLAPR
jgi:hypothetical protein